MSAEVSEAEQLFERGSKLFFEGKYQESVKVLEVVVEMAPADVASQHLLAASRFNVGDVAGALAPAALAVYMAPSHAGSRTILGLVLQRLSRPDGAWRHLAHAARLGNEQAALTLAGEGKDYCRECGGVVTLRGTGASPTSGAACPRCAGARATTSSPRRRVWSWARLGEDDYRSKLTLPGKLLNEIGRGFLARYQSGGDVDELEDAILLLELACATSVESDRATPLSDLGAAYRVRFVCHGLPEDVDYAIDCHEQALAIAPTDPSVRMTILANLGVAYRQRYEVGGTGADLDRAISLLERALSLPADAEQRVAALANAGGLYSLRYLRTRARSDIDRAVELEEQAVAATATGHPRLPGRLSNLAASLGRRADRYGGLADPRSAVEHAERAVEATPQGHPARPTYLGNLGVAHVAIYEATGRRSDIDAAISALRQAVESTPDSGPVLARALALLANAHLARDRVGGEPLGVDRAQTRSLLRRLAAANASPAVDLVHAGAMLGTLANAIGDHQSAVDVLDNTVALLPTLPARESDWADRDQRFGEAEGLVSQAFAAHCALGDLTGAVQIAELGRGVQLAEQMDARSDLTDLASRLPEYATALRRLRVLLGERTAQSGRSSENLAPLWQRYDDLLEEIRSRPGFERFHRVPEISVLRHAAASGTVVMVNVGRDRSDAVLIRPGGELLHVPLPGLRSNRVVDNARALLTGSGDRDLVPAAVRRDSVLTDILGWLWDTAVRPVYDALPHDGSPQRVWWLPIGAVGAFPFHAAGHPDQPGALDAFISSYTPTLRVLAHAHSRSAEADRRQLTVAIARAPGLPTIPGTIAEARDLIRRYPNIPPLMDERATVEQVKSALTTATWAHFACHAGGDADMPSNSGLRLYDGVLTVPEVSRLRLDHAELAYLSACSTAHRSKAAIDESINLASAFHLAGFRHVVASLWPLNDGVAAAAADRFYGIVADGVGGESAPLALRSVCLELRRQYPDRPDLWAALVHSGP